MPLVGLITLGRRRDECIVPGSNRCLQGSFGVPVIVQWNLIPYYLSSLVLTLIPVFMPCRSDKHCIKLNLVVCIMSFEIPRD